MRFLTAMAFMASLLFALPALSADRTMIVFDASGSMWGQIDGKSKIEIARETISKVIPSVAKDTELGLMVYGHRDKGSCADIELVIPPATGTQSAIVDFVDNVQPKGKTPLTQAVREAAEAMKYTEEKTTVVLVTDGLESCEADPCALAEELESKGVDFTAHVVGFGLTEEEGSKVSCLAEKTGGKYFQASDADQLVAALAATVAKPPVIKEVPVEEEAKPVELEYNSHFDSTLSEAGPSLGTQNQDVAWQIYKADANGQPAGDYIDTQYKATYDGNYPAGKYVAKVTLQSLIERLVPFELKDGELTNVDVNFDAGLVTISPKRTPDAEPDKEAAVRIEFGTTSTTNYGKNKVYIPAGEAKLTGTIGPTEVTDTFTIKAGEITERDLIIGSGVVTGKAIYLENGAAVESSEIFFEILSPTKDINGNRKSFGYAYGTEKKLDSPAGDFVLTAKLGSATGEIPYSVKAGETKDVVVNINAGVLAVTAEGAYQIQVIALKKDIQGTQENVLSYAFGAKHQDTLPPGEYTVRVTYEGDKAPQEKPAKVVAGERTEISVE